MGRLFTESVFDLSAAMFLIARATFAKDFIFRVIYDLASSFQYLDLKVLRVLYLVPPIYANLRFSRFHNPTLG